MIWLGLMEVWWVMQYNVDIGLKVGRELDGYKFEGESDRVV
jgi:hypothetical protein